MSKSCARCSKTVYPIEELKCLDKVWHKQCFKCQVCQMTLNMRNYKGFNKEPYCEAHIPKAKATPVAETPEFKRIAENTKIQSNIKYHADFEKAKGKFTQVADDPETLRMRENSKNISNVAYHGDLQKKAVMERQRHIGENNQLGRPGETPAAPQYQAPPPAHQVHENPSPYTARGSSNVIYTSDRGAVSTSSDRRVGSIHDFDPVNDYYGSLTSETNYQQQLHQQQLRYFMPNEYQQRKYQSISDQTSTKRDLPNNGRPQMYPSDYANQTESSNVESVPSMASPPRSSGRVYRAMYEYRAQDVDEVSFVEGDFIVNCTAIDEGWLSGMVQRTGMKGMLPANYVTPAI